MSTLKKISIITLTIVILTSATVFGMLFYASQKTEGIYQSALKSIDNNEWVKANEYLEQIPHYKDADFLEAYIYPNKLYSETIVDIDKNISNFDVIKNYIKDNKEKLSSERYKKYYDDILQLEKTMDFMTASNQAQKQNQIDKANYDKAVSMVRAGDYVGAKKMVMLLPDIGYMNKKAEILSYIDLLNAAASKSGKEMYFVAQRLNPVQKGLFANEIYTIMQPYFSIERWTEVYNKAMLRKQENAVTGSVVNQEANVEVGMTKDALIKTMGQPVKSDVISSRYGNFEIMYYNNNRVFYLENQIVKSYKYV